MSKNKGFYKFEFFEFHMPHMICAVLAAIFNVLGWTMSSRGFALTGAILYAVAAVLFPLYAMFVLIQMILSFVGFAKLKK